ncbi:MAG: DUF3341 domain-containing protein [Armatimonadetes bacterium]|nr:DUF3341 domain-containing protein [Armatimonadota bacterium]
MNGQVGVRARFDDYEAFKKALRTLKDSGMRHYDAYGPTNLKEIEDLMPAKGSGVRVWATAGAFTGLVTFWLMCTMTAVIFGLIVGGKPPISNLPYIIPAYEGTILLGSIAAFIVGLYYARLRPQELPVGYDPRFSRDSYGVVIRCEPGERGRVAEQMRDAGAVEVDELD